MEKYLIELEVAIRHSRLPPHLIGCLTHSINLFEGDEKALSQFIVDVQREAYERTNNGSAGVLAREIQKNKK